MDQEPRYQHRFETLRCCVLIPTYNNTTTLKQVITEVLNYTSNIIIVNDGSTDTTSEILNDFRNLTIITFSKNKGKGTALKVGFKKAEELGYETAITIDSDGQHFPEDLPLFLKDLEENKQEILIIGSRKMDAPDIPEKSSVGNQFSTFWFWVLTGIKLKDTQCGFRMYPLKTINSLHLFTSRFELEIEVLVKAAWKGLEIKNLPVQVFYDTRERVTHFRPFWDVARITVLNIWFVGVALFFIIPRKLFRSLRDKKGE